jgi:hypothetical protein
MYDCVRSIVADVGFQLEQHCSELRNCWQPPPNLGSSAMLHSTFSTEFFLTELMLVQTPRHGIHGFQHVAGISLVIVTGDVRRPVIQVHLYEWHFLE